MKKFLLLLAIVLIFQQYGFCASATSNILDDLKNAVITDITTTVNTVKLETYKAQLAQYQQELKELEEDNSMLGIVKFYKTCNLNRKIADTQAKISAIENETK